MSQRQSELRSPNDDGIKGLGGKLIEREKPAKETGLPGLKLTHTHSHALWHGRTVPPPTLSKIKIHTIVI